MYSIKSSSFFLFFIFSQLVYSQYIPGNTYFSDDGYIEYIAGNMPLVILAPHGGYLQPDSIPDRECTGCVYIRDAFTQELSRLLKDSINSVTGCYPHVIINLLHRKKLDANRDLPDAADGNPSAESAWYSFHDFIDSARSSLIEDFEKGLTLDIHGHGHDIQRLELGYLISKNELQLSNELLNSSTYIDSSSIRNLILNNISGSDHVALLKGSHSLGSISEDKSYPAVPSATMPFPLEAESYFSGGYNTRRYGSKSGGTIDAIQIECDSSVRFGASNRETFADSLSNVILEYMESHYFENFVSDACSPISTPSCDETVPEGLAAIPAPNGTNVFLSWDSISGADLYQAKGRKTGTIPFGQFVTSNTSKNIGGLDPASSYEWKIRARCQPGESITSFSLLDTFSMPVPRIFENEPRTDLTIFPNPATDQITVSFRENTGDKHLIRIIDPFGKIVLIEQVINTNNTVLDLRGLASGFYTIQVISDTILTERMTVTGSR